VAARASRAIGKRESAHRAETDVRAYSYEEAMATTGAMLMAGPAQAAEDEILVQRCLDGQAGAFDALVASHHRRVYNLVYRMVGNAEDAMDLTQEAFLRAYSKLHTFERGRPFLAWLRRIATNLCIDHLRRQGSPDVSLDERTESGAQHADTSPGASPEEALEVSEDARRVLDAVYRLPPRQRAALVLRYVDGMKVAEIARALRVPEGTVKTMLFRGRQAVREMVGEL